MDFSAFAPKADAIALLTSLNEINIMLPSHGQGMSMSNNDDNQHMFARWRNSEVSRNFHRLGLLVAAIILVAGLLLMTKDALGLRLWDLIPADIPILAGGIAIGLTGIGLAALAAYGIVRAIGFAIDRSI
jgi:hypothetical protein